VQEELQDLLQREGIDAVVFCGGTGFSPRDLTVDAVRPFLEREVDGFGELFRALSYAEIGAAAMLSRATAGVIRGCAVFMLPGSEAGVRLAMTRLVIPELGHVVRELTK
jgi:molybdenum cofactor biosynthesis protein B